MMYRTVFPVVGGAVVRGNPTLDSIDGETRAPLQTLLADSFTAQDRAAFGLYLVDVTPPEGQLWTKAFAEVEGVPVAVFEDLPAPTAADVNAERDRRIRLLAAGYTPTERETWHVQASEAKALLADPEAPAPLLTVIAARRDVPLLAMAQIVQGLHDSFATATGTLMASATLLIAQDPIPADFTDDAHWLPDQDA